MVGIGFKEGRCKSGEEVWEELIVSVETEEETDHLLESAELEDKGTGGSRMETREILKNIFGGINKVYEYS